MPRLKSPESGYLRLSLLILLAGCEASPPVDPGPGGGDEGLTVIPVASGLASPVYVAAPPNDPRLFIVEQPGRIRVLDSSGTLRTQPFLDISDRVLDGGERGLLSVAFHPDYAVNGRLFVNYTSQDGATVVERYTVAADPDRADPASAVAVLTVPHPFSNHNGGQIAFGPDGMLYIAMGDGGGAGDPLGHGQDPSTLLGAMLRIDVDGPQSYTVPPDNPLVGTPEARPEIWALGLRNPWRFSFDFIDGRLYVADVGQNRREEINAVDASLGGLNFGWNTMEGSICFDPPNGCSTGGLTLPVLEYSNADNACAVTGGFVYRGRTIPSLHGHYFYGDYCAGFVRSFRLSPDREVLDHREWDLGSLGNISSFGEDAEGELYIVAHQGTIYKLAPSP